MVMTPEEFEERMLKLQSKLNNRNPSKGDYYNEEEYHIDMDFLMMKVLASLGYENGCKVFNDTPKWYA